MTTLLQVSTHKQDFVICPFKCREGICTKLKGLFQNPKIAKIFHAVDNDSLALRRDFNIVLVGAADTKEAWKMLTGAKNAIGFEHMMKALGLPSGRLPHFYVIVVNNYDNRFLYINRPERKS